MTTIFDSSNYTAVPDTESAVTKSAPSSSSSSSRDSTNTRSYLLATVVVFGVSLSAIALAVSSTTAGQSYFFGASLQENSRGDGKVSWTLTRSGYEALSYFTVTDASMQYDFLKSYDAIVEPHADMELYLISDYSIDADYFYRWSVCASADGSSDCRDGKFYTDGTQIMQETINVPCEAGDELVVKITKHTSADNTQTGALKGTALCMYVRREMRYLTEADLSATMDAMYVLYSTEEKKGVKLYGDSFHNSTYYLQAHHFNAAWRDGDHIHEGLGFLAQHIKITNMFEEAMQAVDPSVSMPYWDFTIDVADGNTYPQDTFAFTEDTFGSITPAKDAAWGYTYRNDTIKGGRIPDGRFKHLAADMNYKYANFEQISANYGYLRAPWNANPSPWVSRFSGYTTGLPSCTDHYNWLKDNDYTDFMSDSPYAPHASVHGAIGSVFGCDLMDPLREQGLLVSEYQQNKFCQKWTFLIKELYRKDFLTGAENGACSYTKLNQEGQNCAYVCNKENSKYDNMGLQLENLIATQYTGSVLTNAQYNVFRDFICEGDGAKVFAGDHTESASPADPSFWPIHPTLERLTQAKFLSGGFTDTLWPSDSVNDYVCDKSQCYEDDELDYYAACCYGHYEDDQLLDFITPDKNSGTGPTNKETMDGLNPNNPDYSMPYIYDSFTWDHCTEDFDNLLENLASSSKISKAGGKKDTDSWLLMGDDSASRRERTLKKSGKKASKAFKKSNKKSSKKNSKKGKRSGARGDPVVAAVAPDENVLSSAPSTKPDDDTLPKPDDDAPKDIDDVGVEDGGDDAKPNDDVPVPADVDDVAPSDDKNVPPETDDDDKSGPPAGDDEENDESPSGDDKSPSGDDESPSGDDKSPSGDDESPSGDDAKPDATDDAKAPPATGDDSVSAPPTGDDAADPLVTDDHKATKKDSPAVTYMIKEDTRALKSKTKKSSHSSNSKKDKKSKSNTKNQKDEKKKVRRFTAPYLPLSYHLSLALYLLLI